MCLELCHVLITVSCPELCHVLITISFPDLYHVLITLSCPEIYTLCPTVPAEKVVVNKERLSGSYHLSAYYLAKTLSELPLLLTLPSIYITITYWAAGMNGWAGFFGTWFFLLFGGFMAQVHIIYNHCVGVSVSNDRYTIVQGCPLVMIGTHI